ncbi:MAG: winged helix-turn-helix domain-containing protein, partial [Propionibacteriaceae bacterium]
MTEPQQLTIQQARRIALAAQGLHRPRPGGGPVGIRQVQQVIDRVGLLQIDSVNVLARAHLLPLYSRLGPYDAALLDRAAGRSPRRLVEAWAHVASFVPPTTYRLLGWRRRADRDRLGGQLVDGVPLRSSPVLEEVRAVIADRGPITSPEVHALFEDRFPRTGAEWGWNWTVAKAALEYLFIVGGAAVAGRTAAFERRYDLPERVLPADVLAMPEPSDADAVRGLVEISARAHGIGTELCLADYFRLGRAGTRRAVDELVEEGVLERVRVVGWDRAVVRHADAALPRRAEAAALLSPFDPLVFERRRLEELFGLRYRIEIYVPPPQRRWGYYVHPFLLGDS